MNRRALYLTCCLGVIGTPVVAVCPSPAPKACSLFFDSDALFVAKVLSRTYADNDESIRFEVRVSRVLRGGMRPDQATRRSESSSPIQPLMWFQLAKFRSPLSLIKTRILTVLGRS